ncbi:SDR family NAD(P)-dependent oxidoreductase [Halomonas caseinilytica]|uniref:SDR family NAD(P)-dependent oxidoreductase n=1 Tax=Halomonas caseinilytica TaxID=438744 RepID=UPI0007E58EE7|nr:SDR family NAD(P)-dependent oxidoreductase [Halomonas caseinilytica]SEN63391.1 gluconate 5-dehydrogenase [Halomonas caseinilytica]
MPLEAFNLDGKSAIVTGAGRGLGKAIALGLASAGAKVLLASRTPEHLSDTAAEIENSGGQALRASVDISDPASCAALISKAEDEFGQLDILVCNAATNIQGPAADMTPSEWSRVINTEMSGCFYLSQAAYKTMAKQRNGSIIMISANSSTVGYTDLIGVATAKGGVDMMARNLAIEWGQNGIRVNTINPGFTEHVPEDGADVAAGDGDLEDDIRTATPLERRGRVEEFANPAVFLASDAASYVTGHNLVVDGGYSVK